eukprot:58250-Lingulodinium_polyedra.AAC.1
MTPTASVAVPSRATTHALVEEGIRDACLADCEYDRRGNPLGNRPHRSYTLRDLMWIPKETA